MPKRKAEPKNTIWLVNTTEIPNLIATVEWKEQVILREIVRSFINPGWMKYKAENPYVLP